MKTAMFKKMFFNSFSLIPIPQIWGVDRAVFRYKLGEFILYIFYIVPQNLITNFPNHHDRMFIQNMFFLFLSAFDSLNNQKLSPILSENFILSPMNFKCQQLLSQIT